VIDPAAGGPDLPNAAADYATSKWLRRWGTQAERYGFICTGAFALGHAGLPDGRTAATHWRSASKLAAMFPMAHVEHDRIYAGDDKLVTSTGVTAEIDLALALVGGDHGAAVSLACAKGFLVVAQRQGFQSQFSPLLLPISDPVTPLGKVQAYVLAHPSEPFSVERLAAIAGICARSIARLFVNELGLTPHDFIEGVRLDQARNMLECTDIALKSIAFDCGFATPERMRGAFQRRLGVSPLQYRDSFRATFMGTGQAFAT
jgi:transcriptional regulator GlxA family with amidase domain